MDLTPFWLSLRVAAAAMMLVVPLCGMAAWWLAHGRRTLLRAAVETVLTLPLVLPPTVVGFYLLQLLGRGTTCGVWLNDRAHIQLLFTWQGAALASAIMAAPLYTKTAAAAFASVDHDLLQAGRTMGAGELTLLWRVIVPLSYRGLLAALALGFARALGEFGATLMVAGSIPGATQTMPLALYAAVQAGRDAEAMRYTLFLTAAAFLIIALTGGYQVRVAAARGDRV